MDVLRKTLITRTVESSKETKKSRAGGGHITQEEKDLTGVEDLEESGVKEHLPKSV